MKIWRFYKLPEKDNKKKSYDLYAITNNKEMAKTFMKTRNMNKFLVKCSKEDKETYAEYANKNLDHILDYRSLVTKELMENGFYVSTKVKVLCTDFEYKVSTETESLSVSFLDESYWAYTINPNVFNKKLKEALNTIEYNRMYKIYNSNGAPPGEDDYSAPDYWIDEFAVFISTFKDTF